MKKIICAALSICMLLTMLCGCTKKPEVSVDGLKEKYQIPVESEKMPEPETPASSEKTPEVPVKPVVPAADPLDFETEDQLRKYICGTWQFFSPYDGDMDADFAITLTEDGLFHCMRNDDSAVNGGYEYVGNWSLDSCNSEDGELPDLLCLDLQPGNTDLDGLGTLGDFALVGRSICDGAYIMEWSQYNNGDSILSMFYDTFYAALRKADGAPAPDAQGEKRRNDYFYANCWKAEQDAKGEWTLWLDDSDVYGWNENLMEALPYTLASDCELRCSPEAFTPGIYVAEVWTDKNGDISILNWAVADDDPLLFDRDESVLWDLHLGMTEDEVKAILGEPDSVNESAGGDTFIYGTEIAYYYGDAELDFYDYQENGEMLLGSVWLDSENISLSSGLSVGCALEDLLYYYSCDEDLREIGGDDPWGMYLYGEYLYTYENGYALPEEYEQTAYVNYPMESDDEYTITYTAYLPMGDKLEETNLVFYLDLDNVITCICWDRYMF
ncbi:MAG: hypothetical protein MJ118_05290 [Clostridia bacterium]|nr:hypothetical protein [Clostridia bacterium]